MAIAALVLYYTARYARPAVWVVAPLVISLALATVYCRYHYAIDVVAGLATTAILVPLWRRRIVSPQVPVFAAPPVFVGNFARLPGVSHAG